MANALAFHFRVGRLSDAFLQTETRLPSRRDPRVYLRSSSMPLMPFSRARHVGRSTTRYSFEISSLNIERLPSNLSATGLIVQCRRGPKVASTKTVELMPAMKAAAGGISFGTQKLSFSATLCVIP